MTRVTTLICLEIRLVSHCIALAFANWLVFDAALWVKILRINWR